MAVDKSNRMDLVFQILMADYDAIRAEIRSAEARHEKVSFWLSSGLLAATIACFKDFKIGFAFIPLVILAYYAHRLYSHTLHVATLSQWVMRIEDLVDRLLQTDGLLNWERDFVRQKLKSFSPSSILSPHYVTEGFLLLPSFVVFFICVAYAPLPVTTELGFPLWLARSIAWGVYPALFLGLWILFFCVSGTANIEKARHLAVSTTYDSIVKSLIDLKDTSQKK